MYCIGNSRKTFVPFVLFVPIYSFALNSCRGLFDSLPPMSYHQSVAHGCGRGVKMDNKVVESVEKRKPPAAGKGRVKGTPNKITKTIKEALELSFENVGGAEYLAQMAFQEPVAYMGLLGKVLPTQVKLSTDKPIEVTFNVIEPNSAAN